VLAGEAAAGAFLFTFPPSIEPVEADDEPLSTVPAEHVTITTKVDGPLRDVAPVRERLRAHLAGVRHDAKPGAQRGFSEVFGHVATVAPSTDRSDACCDGATHMTNGDRGSHG